MFSRRILPANRLHVVLALLAASMLQSVVSAAAATGPLRPLESNPRYFTDGSGKAIYLTGSHTWANFAMDLGKEEPVPMDYNAYLDFLVAHHHNFFRGWVWDPPYSLQGYNGGPFHWGPQPWERTGPGVATDGKPKFDLTRFNQAWFDRVRDRVIAARDRGIYVSIMLFQGYAWQHNRNETDGFSYDGRNNINGVDVGPKASAATLKHPAVTTAQEAYVRKVIDTVNDLDNVLYEIANEAHNYSTAWQYHLIDFIHAYERTKPKQHPVGMTSQFIGKVAHEELMASAADWVSPGCKMGYIDNPPVATGDKVVIVDSDHGYTWKSLKEHGPARHQSWVWKNFLRGYQVLFMDPYLIRAEGETAERNHPGGIDPTNAYFGLTPDLYWEPMRNALGRTRLYAEKLDLAAAIPHPELVTTGYCLAQPGREYLIYQPATDSAFSVELVGGTYTYEWYDPTAGKVTATGDLHVPKGSHSFTAPFQGDAVFYLKRL